MKISKMEPIEVGYKTEDKVIFYLRRISVSESDEIEARLADTEGATDKYRQRYRIYLDCLIEFSCDPPAGYVKENGEIKTVPLTGEIGEALETRFADRENVDNEWILRDAFLRFKQALQPESRFKPLSA